MKCSPKHRFIAAMIAGSLMASANVPAADEEFLPELRSQNGVIYLSGGVGLDEREAMQAVRNEYSLWLTFAQTGVTAYSSDTEVAIRDSKGALVLEATAEGPWLMIKLPPGRYRVTARQDETSGSHNVTVNVKGVTRQVVRLQEKRQG